MRYLTQAFAVTALRRGRQIEQVLGGVQAGERRGIRWISLSPGREGIGVCLHEVEDVGTDTFWDLTEFPPLDPDDETWGLVTRVTAPEEAIRIAEHDLGADPCQVGEPRIRLRRVRRLPGRPLAERST